HPNLDFVNPPREYETTRSQDSSSTEPSSGEPRPQAFRGKEEYSTINPANTELPQGPRREGTGLLVRPASSARPPLGDLFKPPGTAKRTPGEHLNPPEAVQPSVAPPPTAGSSVAPQVIQFDLKSDPPEEPLLVAMRYFLEKRPSKAVKVL